MSGSLSSTFGIFRPAENTGITFVGAVSSTTGSGTGSALSATYPTIAANDYALFVLSKRNTTALTASPSGSTQIFTTSGTSISSVLYVKKLIGNETGTAVTFSWAFSTAALFNMYIYRGVDTTTQLDTSSASTTVNTASSTMSYPSISTVTNNAKIIRIGTTEAANTTTYTIPTFPSHTQRFSGVSIRGGSNSNGNIGQVVSDYTQPSFGSTGTANGTINTVKNQVLFTVALRPA